MYSLHLKSSKLLWGKYHNATSRKKQTNKKKKESMFRNHSYNYYHLMQIYHMVSLLSLIAKENKNICLKGGSIKRNG